MNSLIEPILKRYKGKISVGTCKKRELYELLQFDHHVVEINCKKGVLITYHLMMNLTNKNENYEIIVVHANVNTHPTAPDNVKQIVNNIKWERM
jgi:hypothetical protein